MPAERGDGDGEARVGHVNHDCRDRLWAVAEAQ